MNYNEHPDFPALVALDDEMFRLAERCRSRLSDLVHYVTNSQWADAKLALNEVGEKKRKLNDLWRKGSEINSKIRASMAPPDAPAPVEEPVEELVPEPEAPLEGDAVEDPIVSE